jgi:very-short-patch-repair endonuclease
MTKNKYRNWTQEQLDRLLSSYGTKSVVEIAQDLAKPIGSIYYILEKENVNLKLSYWSPEEISVLKRYYSSLSNEELRRKLFRSEDSIQLKAASLGLRKESFFWSDKEVDQLRSMKLAGETYEFMCSELDRTKSAIHNKLIELGLTSDIRRWSDDELLTIELMSKGNKYTYQDIACKVNATREQVSALCAYRGWNKEIKRSSSVGEEKILIVLQKLGIKEIWTQHHIGSGLRLDFFLPEYNLGIEFDGIQHDQYVEFFHKNPEGFEYRKQLDHQKDLICSSKNIKVLRISYQENNIESLIKEQINELSIREVVVKPNWLIAKEKDIAQKAREYRKQQYQRMKELKHGHQRFSTSASNTSEEEA